MDDGRKAERGREDGWTLYKMSGKGSRKLLPARGASYVDVDGTPSIGVIRCTSREEKRRAVDKYVEIGPCRRESFPNPALQSSPPLAAEEEEEEVMTEE